MLPVPVPRAPTDPTQLLSVTAVPDPRVGCVVVEVAGEVDAHTALVLEVCLLSRTRRPEVRTLVVDLSRVTFLGAAAATVLVRAHRRCRRRGTRLVVRTGGRRRVLRTLELTGAADLLAVDPTEAEPRVRGPRTAARPRPGRIPDRRPLRASRGAHRPQQSLRGAGPRS